MTTPAPVLLFLPGAGADAVRDVPFDRRPDVRKEFPQGADHLA